MKAFHRVSSRLVLTMSSCLLVGAACASGSTAEPADAPSPQFTSLANGIPHPTIGCGGAVVLTPQPGSDFSDPVGSVSSSVTSFYAKAARLHMTWASTLDCTQTGITHGLAPHASNAPAPDAAVLDSATPFLSTNWSGYDIGNTAQYVQSGWTIPTVANPPPGYHYSSSGYYSATWSGIGGGIGAGDPLIQAGSAQDVSTSGAATYYFWYEVVGGPSPTPGEVQISSPVAHPGDDVGVAAIWLAATSQVEFGICDFSDTSPPGGCVQYYLTCTPSQSQTCTPGTSVEWIEEAPQVYGSQSNMADFGTVHFYNNCWAAAYTPGVPVTCSPINVSGVTSPTAIWFHEHVFGCDQDLAIPSELNMSNGSDFDDVYQLPDNTCGK